LVAVQAAEPVLEEDGTFTLVTPTEGAERHIERGLERMRTEHPGKTVELEASRTVTDTVTFEHSWGIAPGMWPRFLAKVSIALGHLAIADFDGSREAKMLRWLLRGRLHSDLLAPGFELAAVPQKLESRGRPIASSCARMSTSSPWRSPKRRLSSRRSSSASCTTSLRSPASSPRPAVPAPGFWTGAAGRGRRTCGRPAFFWSRGSPSSAAPSACATGGRPPTSPA
jgi:hypothetical protein